MFIRSPYNYDMSEVSQDTGLCCEDESLTVQDEKENCDINVIVKRFGVTGVAPQDIRTPLVGDFTQVGDFRSAMDAVVSARNSFNAMSAEVRARFQNDPQLFLEFCSDSKNLSEMRRMGLAVPESAPVPPAPPAAPPNPG